MKLNKTEWILGTLSVAVIATILITGARTVHQTNRRENARTKINARLEHARDSLTAHYAIQAKQWRTKHMGDAYRDDIFERRVQMNDAHNTATTKFFKSVSDQDLKKLSTLLHWSTNGEFFIEFHENANPQFVQRQTVVDADMNIHNYSRTIPIADLATGENTKLYEILQETLLSRAIGPRGRDEIWHRLRALANQQHADRAQFREYCAEFADRARCAGYYDYCDSLYSAYDRELHALHDNHAREMARLGR